MRSALFLLLNAALFFSACKNSTALKLEKITALADYPSGSGIAFINKKLYVMGDDAPYLLITDTGFNRIDTISFFAFTEKRIPKEIKADPEAATMIMMNKRPYLFLAGSGSLIPQRNKCWIIDPLTKEKITVSLDTFYNRLKNAGIKELNIEGIAQIPAGMVLANRGSKGYPKNQLVFTSRNFWQDQTNAPISIASLGVNTDTSSFTGISGLEYSPLADKLLITLSTEDTKNAMADGAIGKSYLWIVNDISNKKTYLGINPTKVIDLEEMDMRFRGRKIESVCITRENKKEMELVFVSDDDKGGSELFKGILINK